MNRCHVITRELMDEISTQARTAPRLRKNMNIHVSEQEPCNRLLNAVEPGTYFVPHCHSDPSKDETMIILRGRMGILIFDEHGNVTGKTLLEAGSKNVGITIPHGVFHSMVVLEPGTVVFETKAGPYRPLQQNEIPAWAPREGSPDAPASLVKMKHLFDA